MSYLKRGASAVMTPPQTEPLNERQVKNSAGGHSFPVDHWTRLKRFLILGSEGGSYYATEQKMTIENVKALAECIQDDGEQTVRKIVEVSDAGRAAKNDPALLALAYAASKGDANTRAAALDALPKVARIGTHLFHFVDFAREFRGWGRGLRSAVANWYINQDADKLADQVTKYQQRDGWNHRDLLRLTHPKFSGAHQAIAKWVVKDKTSKALPERITGHIKLQQATTAKEAVGLIRKYGLVRESVPTELLKEAGVWEALLEKMPVTAMIRNLGNMSKVGLLAPLSDASKMVVQKLNAEALRKGRVHPITVLIAQKTYASGHSIKGSGTWTPVPQVINALDDAYYLAFGNIEPTGKNFYLGMDISGSMWTGSVCGIDNFSPAVASGAMAMVTVRSEQNYYAAGFTAGADGYGGRWRGSSPEMTLIPFSPRQRLDDVVANMQSLSNRMGGTDCALPILDAINKNLNVDVFIIYTDSETYTGNIHPVQALEKYRQKTGKPAKLVVCGMVSNGFSIADPNDGGMLDVCGFDTASPNVIADFAR